MAQIGSQPIPRNKQPMKIIIDTKVLSSALADVAPFAPVKAPVPILSYVKVTTKGNRIKFEANNQQASVRRYVRAAEIDQDGSFLVDCADITSLISKCKGDTITLTIDNDTLTVQHSKGKAEFQTMRVDEYPNFDMPTEGITEVTIPYALLCDCINTGRGFVGNDDFRAVMKPIYAYIKNGEFGYCATDTRKLATDHNPIENAEGVEINWFIEPFVFSSILKAGKDIQDVTVKIAPTQVSYRIGDTVIQTVQTQGRYPDFNRVIPKEWTMTCAVDRDELMDSLRRTALLCEDTRLVKLDISRMDMTISTDNLVKMKKSSEVMQHSGCDGEIKFGMQIDFLTTCLAACTANEVELRMTNGARPVLICQHDRPNAIKLVMPMTLNS